MPTFTSTTPIFNSPLGTRNMFDFLRLSQIGQCPRKISYYFLRNTPVRRITNQRMIDGLFHELEVKLRLHHLGVVFEVGFPYKPSVVCTIDEFQIVGHPDGIVRISKDIVITNEKFDRYVSRGRYLLEIKSASDGSYWKFVKKGLRESHPDYFDQVQAYMGANSFTDLADVASTNFHEDIEFALDGTYSYFGQDAGPFIDIDIPTQTLEVFKNKTSGDLWTEVIPKDADYIDGLYDRWQNAWNKVQKGELANRLHVDIQNYECKECPFINECWGLDEVSI